MVYHMNVDAFKTAVADVMMSPAPRRVYVPRTDVVCCTVRAESGDL